MFASRHGVRVGGDANEEHGERIRHSGGRGVNPSIATVGLYVSLIVCDLNCCEKGVHPLLSVFHSTLAVRIGKKKNLNIAIKNGKENSEISKNLSNYSERVLNSIDILRYIAKVIYVSYMTYGFTWPVRFE